MAELLGSAVALLSRGYARTPLIAVRPRTVERRAHAVLAAFPGTVMYAVKCNDSPEMLHALYAGGVSEFDVASLGEIRTLRGLFGDRVRCHFMHPVKKAEAIAEAYHVHGVRRFAFDHPEELAKIRQATNGARDLELILRLAVAGEGAVLSLSGKFGVAPPEAAPLLRAARAHASVVGLTFHVGSQCLEPRAFARAITDAAEVARAAGGIDHLDVGGGFPAQYRGDEPPFERFVEVIRTAVRENGLADVTLACEPGRLLVADGASVLTRVELRRGHALFLDDGVYGNLAELRWLGPCFPIRVLRPDGPSTAALGAFDLFGPTCDSIDSMPGPHMVASDVRSGDWLEVGMAGAYTTALRTRFNGFGETHTVLLRDAPWYLQDAPRPRTVAAA